MTVSAIRDGGTVPKQPGIYGWWFDEALLQALSADVFTRDGWRLLYAGIAPSAPPKATARPRSLRDRLSNHCRGPIATSTLRRTVVALIRSQEGFCVDLNAAGKPRMSVGDEARLTEWLDAHARVMWMTTPEPWNIEDELLTHGPRLPLNIQGSSDPFRFELKRLRRELTDMNVDDDDQHGDPRRFQASAEDIKPLGKVRIVDHLTEEEKARNAEHDRIVKEAIDEMKRRS